MEKFRRKHIFQILSNYNFSYPLDGTIRQYFRSNKSIGQQDRSYISDKIHDLIRNKTLIEYQLQSSTPISNNDYSEHLDFLLREDFQHLKESNNYPAWIKYSVPQPLYSQICESLDPFTADVLIKDLSFRGPRTIRTNRIKTTRDALIRDLWNYYKCGVKKTKLAQQGLIFSKLYSDIYSMEHYQSGDFEVQDEGSQIVAEKIPAKPDMTVLDFCAGAGGKSLAIAPGMNNSGQIYLYDKRHYIIKYAKKRLKRAGVHNYTYVDNIHKLHGMKLDLVILDVPCTGTGTLRRNPWLKYKFSEELLQQKVEQQRQIMGQAMEFCRDKGQIVYITCSLLNAENQEQAYYFANKYSLEIIEQFQTDPLIDRMDGFYFALFKRT